MKTKLTLLFAIFLSVLIVGCGGGSSGSGGDTSIQGVLLSKSGQPLPRVPVQLFDNNNEQRAEVQTSEQGEFAFYNLPFSEGTIKANIPQSEGEVNIPFSINEGFSTARIRIKQNDSGGVTTDINYETDPIEPDPINQDETSYEIFDPGLPVESNLEVDPGIETSDPSEEGYYPDDQLSEDYYEEPYDETSEDYVGEDGGEGTGENTDGGEGDGSQSDDPPPDE